MGRYRGTGLAAELGDLVAGWKDAEAQEEIAGTVVCVHADSPDVTVAALEFEECPEGVEPDPADVGDGVHFKRRDGRCCVVRVRTLEVAADKLTLVHRRKGKHVRQGVLIEADPQAARERERRGREAHAKKMESASFVPPKEPEHARPVTPLPPHKADEKPQPKK